MTRLKVSLGALMVCAASFAAFGASNAAASTLHECTKAEATSTSVRFEDSNCQEESAKGRFATTPLSAGSHKVTAEGTTPFVLSSAPFGIKQKITCKKMMTNGATAANEEVGGKMQVSGGASIIEFSECEVNEPAGCTVAEPIKTKETTLVTEDLAGGVMRTKYTPKIGTEFTTITLGNCGLVNGGHTTNGALRSESKGVTTQEFSTTSGSELTFFGTTVTLTGTYDEYTETAPNVKGPMLSLETP